MSASASDDVLDAATAPAAPAAPIEGQDYTDQNNVPSLFEALMAGVMYHRPKEPIPFLRQCLEKIYDGGDHPRPAAGGENGGEKIEYPWGEPIKKIEYPWNLFVGDKKRRKQKPPSAPGSAGALGPKKSVLPPIGGAGGRNEAEAPADQTSDGDFSSRATSPLSPLSPFSPPGAEVMRFHSFEGADLVPNIKPSDAALTSAPISEAVVPSPAIDDGDDFTPAYAPDEPIPPVSAVSATEAPALAANPVNPTTDEVAMGAVPAVTPGVTPAAAAAAAVPSAEAALAAKAKAAAAAAEAAAMAELVLGLADVEGDGKLDKDELIAVGETEEDASKLIATLDKDGDGKLDAAEFAAGLAEAAAAGGESEKPTGPGEAKEPPAAAEEAAKPELR